MAFFTSIYKQHFRWLIYPFLFGAFFIGLGILAHIYVHKEWFTNSICLIGLILCWVGIGYLVLVYFPILVKDTFLETLYEIFPRKRFDNFNENK